MVSYVTGLLRLGSSSRLSLPRLNSASYFFTMLYEGAFSPSVTTCLHGSPWEGRKEFFYLTTHSFIIYGYMASDIWLRTILIARKETRCRHIGYSFSDKQQCFFYMHHPTDRIAHTTAFVTPVVKHWLEREIAQWVHHEGSIRRPIASRANALTTELYLTPWNEK